MLITCSWSSIINAQIVIHRAHKEALAILQVSGWSRASRAAQFAKRQLTRITNRFTFFLFFTHPKVMAVLSSTI